MKKISRTKKFITLLTLFSIILNGCFIAYAATQNDLNKKTNEKQQVQKKIDDNKKKQDSAKKEADKLEKNIKKITAELDAISATLNELGEKKATLLLELANAETNEKAQEEKLKKRLRSVYEDGAISYFSILSSSESVFDFFYNLENLKLISEYDDKILNELKAIKKEIVEKKEDLDKVINKEKEKEKELETANSNLKYQAEQKQKYVKDLDKDIEKLREEYNKIEQEEAALRAEIARKASQQSGSNVPKTYVGGQFIWPTPSCHTITSAFGYRNHPTLKQYKFHSGIDIGVYAGNDVLAVADGVVTVSTYESGYGNYVAINHGGGIVSLYGHNSKLLVRAGQSVKQGQVIAISGSTGRSTGPHLHFEILVNGSAVNPMNYFK
ncbi:MAG: peptidoglycan DD-metalloendopeptidase family protein [Clostridia bacterium]|nr:peptidoglycan DD-metalloendopeptidase family protein [Clostridia bacterium]